jgi:spore coat protein U-like protein
MTSTGIAFGGYDPFSAAPTISSGTIAVNCILVIAIAGSYDIALSPGSSGSYSQRKMTQGGSSLNYNLYTTPGRTQVWGDGSGGTGIVTPTFTALLVVNQTSTVYGTIPAGQNVPKGVYGDTIVVTITY